MRLGVLAAAVVIGALGLGTPAQAAQPSTWVPAPPDVQQQVVKAMNAAAKADGGRQHGVGCYAIWSLKGRKDIVTVNFKPNVSQDACGSTASFGLQVYRKSGGRWARVAQTPRPGGPCNFEAKVPASIKNLVKAQRVCR